MLFDEMVRLPESLDINRKACQKTIFGAFLYKGFPKISIHKSKQKTLDVD